jgi:hypothetical protein
MFSITYIYIFYTEKLHLLIPYNRAGRKPTQQKSMQQGC